MRSRVRASLEPQVDRRTDQPGGRDQRIAEGRSARAARSPARRRARPAARSKPGAPSRAGSAKPARPAARSRASQGGRDQEEQRSENDQVEPPICSGRETKVLRCRASKIGWATTSAESPSSSAPASATPRRPGARAQQTRVPHRRSHARALLPRLSRRAQHIRDPRGPDGLTVRIAAGGSRRVEGLGRDQDREPGAPVDRLPDRDDAAVQLGDQGLSVPDSRGEDAAVDERGIDPHLGVEGGSPGLSTENSTGRAPRSCRRRRALGGAERVDVAPAEDLVADRDGGAEAAPYRRRGHVGDLLPVPDIGVQTRS